MSETILMVVKCLFVCIYGLLFIAFIMNNGSSHLERHASERGDE